MSKAAVEVRASSIRIVELEVPLKEVAGYFRSIPAEERVFTLTKAIEVGVFCLEMFTLRVGGTLAARLRTVPASAQRGLGRGRGSEYGGGSEFQPVILARDWPVFRVLRGV